MVGYNSLMIGEEYWDPKSLFAHIVSSTANGMGFYCIKYARERELNYLGLVDHVIAAALNRLDIYLEEESQYPRNS